MDKGSSFRRGFCPMESVSNTFHSLDTVRALHQTVVSLRAALEEAKFEIQRLRSQISTEAEIKESTKQQVKVKPQTLRKGSEDTTKDDIHDGKQPSDDIKQSLGVTREISGESDVIKPAEPTQSTEQPLTSSFFLKESRKSDKRAVPDISVVAYPQVDDLNKMASKIDVKIKVMSNIKVEGSNNDISTGSQLLEGGDQDTETASGSGTVKRTTMDTVKIKNDVYGHLIVSHAEKGTEKKDHKSESDSVFMEESQASASEDIKPQTLDKDQEVIKEEVDDIELIFSSEENREPIQEDLVSISEYDPWQATGISGTPVLVKFASLPSEQDAAKQGNKETKIPISTTCDSFYEVDNIPLLKENSLESADSIQNQSSEKSSSLDKENDRERMGRTSLSRDESIDFFDNRDASAVGRKWTNCNVLVETDISKCGIIEEQTSFEMYRRNTCPNPPAYRPILTRHTPSRLGSRFCRRGTFGTVASAIHPGPVMNEKIGPKKSSSAQTEISALPDYWKSESQLNGNRYHMGGPCTLPSKFVPTFRTGCPKHTLRITERTQEARRVLLSDINFTSMVPELSRSADHLCQDERGQEQVNKQVTRYYKGNLLKTPDYALKGITPSTSMTSPGVSQWTVNENSFGTQTIQTGESWGKRGDSFDSCRSYSTDSRCSGLDPQHRSRSVPSIRCVICKQAHANHGIRTSESMHYTPRVTFQEPACKVRGSLPDLRHDCVCFRKYTGRPFAVHRDSSGSTESLLDEAEAFIRKSMDSSLMHDDPSTKRTNLRRMSENDIQRDYIPSKQSLPFLPKTAKCLKPGHLAKVISKNGRVVVGRVKYVGPLITTCKSGEQTPDDLYVGVQLQSKCGDCDGTYEGRRIFDCEPLQGLFVPFKKVVMAWTG